MCRLTRVSRHSHVPQADFCPRYATDARMQSVTIHRHLSVSQIAQHGFLALTSRTSVMSLGIVTFVKNRSRANVNQLVVVRLAVRCSEKLSLKLSRLRLRAGSTCTDRNPTAASSAE